MKLSNETIPYLKDEKFSDGLYLTIASPERRLVNRIDYICRYAKGKKILHVGCLDHIPLIEKKISQGVWLHKRIEEVAEKQIGIDINREGLEWVRSRLGYANVYYENIISNDPPGEFIANETWDAMILGEILEHVDNPVAFLNQLKIKYAPYVREVLITVPNAFAMDNFMLALKQKECINTDHRSWFSIYTLSKNLSLAGFGEFDFHFVTSYPSDYKNNWLKRILVNRFPALRNTIVMTASFQ
jgi:hypothetical protein